MIKLTMFAILLTSTQALMQCPPNACAEVVCAHVDNCNGRLNKGGGWCGCCDICMTQLGEGENCFQTMLMGIPHTVECAAGLECNRDTRTCEPVSVQEDETVVGPCQRRLEEIRQSQQHGLPLLGVEEPKCDVNGYFSPVQCLGSMCYCVDTMGAKLQGYGARIEDIANMNCQCATDQHTYMQSGLIGKLFYCETNGNYRSTQTTARTIVSLSQIGSVSTVNGACATELASSLASSLLGAFVPECDADGNYGPRQCQGSECYCVRKDGTKIESYSSPIAMKAHVTCQCARDKDRQQSMGLLGQIHNCRANGNYQQYQCLGSECFCTDDFGAKIGSHSVPIANINDLIC